jgi:hypothetical protein
MKTIFLLGLAGFLLSLLIGTVRQYDLEDDLDDWLDDSDSNLYTW